ncbi:mannose-6-phosphate isomerase, class I [Treponema phagedenis]|uniref:mannose-6-phosphate isomerase, class I n=1 Tax=Treponema phagedenis TaxID=162 RepID=UPI0011E67DBF|nr:mannose-6-phosphate isomerase, class I [Treponema phagedenis]QEK07506.1 mannose-6-phosphate isomerase, class I [Treponema phagedenis]
MRYFYKLDNTIRTYSWGSKQGIASVLGKKNISNDPWAELWMGAHPAAPSMIDKADGKVSLLSLIEANQELLLGKKTAAAFGSLSFLFKILSAGSPLSIQVHPNSEQAKKGFARENHANIPLDDYARNYKDENHKPEIMLALTPFTALCGFRKKEETLHLFETLHIDFFDALIQKTLRQNPSEDEFTGSFYENLLQENEGSVRSLLDNCKARIQKLSDGRSLSENPFNLALKLAAQYPSDSAILAPLYLNIIELNPGQAIYLSAGILHAYVEGTGLELMANSDNVLRAGLTGKHIDKKELLAITSVKSFSPVILTDDKKDSLFSYKTPAKEFELSRLSIKNKKTHIQLAAAVIILVTEGRIIVTDKSGNESSDLSQGDSLFIGAGAEELFVEGEGTAYIAGIPV